MAEKKWFEGDMETCDACVLCMHGQKSPDGDTRHHRIARQGKCDVEKMMCDGCPWQGEVGEVMPDDDVARVWMDEQATTVAR